LSCCRVYLNWSTTTCRKKHTSVVTWNTATTIRKKLHLRRKALCKANTTFYMIFRPYMKLYTKRHAFTASTRLVFIW
jgi:hypothetical protein